MDRGTNLAIPGFLPAPLDILIEEHSVCPSPRGICPSAIRGWWEIDLRFQPAPDERAFEHDVVLCLSDGLGAAYVSSEAQKRPELGSCAHRALADAATSPAAIAILDSLLATRMFDGLQPHEATGDTKQLSLWRAALIAEAAADLTGNRLGKTAVVVGAVAAIAKELSRLGFVVRMVDNDEGIRGTVIGGTLVEAGGKNTLELIELSDVAIVTGMTLANGSFEAIRLAATRGQTKLLLYAETGSAVAVNLVQRSVIDAAVAEPFPWYTFGQPTRIFTTTGG